MTGTKSCILCASEINDKARKCIHCGSSQRGWINTLTYMSNTVGLLSVSGALILFSVNNLPKTRKLLFWKDEIQVIRFEQPYLHRGRNIRSSEVTLLNKGDGKALVSHIISKTENKIDKTSDEIDKISNEIDKTSISLTIQKIIKPGDIAKIKEEKNDKSLILTTSYTYISSISNEEWQLVNDSAKDIYNFCFLKTLFSANDPIYKQMYEFHEGKLNQNKFESTLYFTSERSKKLKTHEFTTYELIAGLRIPQCGYNKESRTFSFEKETVIKSKKEISKILENTNFLRDSTPTKK